ncbi:hypothetical protein F5X97DRAFT_329500 [Nemania serpens]|nr:hypothetical protein F5X97DRAFT_329500 [Nemania serpens]
MIVVVAQPLYVGALDVHRCKAVLDKASLLFAVSSATFATARSIPVLIAGCAVQGVSAGGFNVFNQVLTFCPSLFDPQQATNQMMHAILKTTCGYRLGEIVDIDAWERAVTV